jgi:membrane protease subunit HflK
MSDVPTRKARGEQLGAGLQSLVRTLQVLFFLLRITIIVIFVWLLFSGVFFVDEQEEAMLFHFGKLDSRVVDPAQGPTTVLTSGRWYWAWPYPIDTVTRVPAHKSVNVSTENHFSPPINTNATDAATAAIKTESLVPGQGGYLLTHDANIIHAQWTVTYRVGDAQKYYLNFYHDPEVSAKDRDISKQRGIEALIRDLLENAALAETRLWRAEDVIRGSRTVKDAKGEDVPETLRANVEKRLIALVEKLDLGIEVQQVNAKDPQPPLAVGDAFQRVSEASQTQDEVVRNAEAYAERQRRLAEGEARQIEQEAIAYRTRIVESLRADRKYFEAMLQEFRKSPDTVLTTLYTDTISDVLQQVRTKYVIHATDDGSQELRLQIGPAIAKPGSTANSTDTNGN